MIVKKVPRKQERSTKRAVRAHAAKLGKYIVNAHRKDALALAQFEDDSYAQDLGHYAAGDPEKVVAWRVKHFKGSGFSDHLAHMDKLLADLDSDKESVDHYVISWHDSDVPTVEETFDAWNIFDRCLGIERCPSFEAIHGNTANPHTHKSVLRIDPQTGEAIARPHGGWDIDAAHRALAVIASRYPQWKVTPNRLYDIQDGRLIHRDTGAVVGDADDPSNWVPLLRIVNSSTGALRKKLLNKVDYQSLLYEEDTGFKSRKRVAIEEAVPILRAAKDWSDAHRQLAKLGIALELANNKSGANVVIDEITVKASISDSTSLQKLEVQWGPFRPRTGDIQVAAFVNRLMHPSDPERASYHSAKRAFTASLTEMLGEVHQAERRYNSSALYRNCDPAKLMRSSFPSFEDWKAGSAIPDFTGIFSGASRACGLAMSEPSRPRLRHFAGYEACPTGKGVAYRKVHDLYNRPAVFDAGKRVYVNDGSDDSIIVALRLMSERYPDLLLQPFGPPDFISKVEKLANDKGIQLQIRRDNRPLVINAEDNSEVVPLTATDISTNQNQAVRAEPAKDIPTRTSSPKSKEEIRRDAEQAAFNAAMANQQGR